MLIWQTGYCLSHYDRNEELKRFIRNGNNGEAKALLQKIPDPCDLVDNVGFTLLHSAVKHSNAEILKYLIEIGCDINAQDVYGFTPLMLAVQLEDLTITEILLENNANISIIALNGDSVLDVACRRCISRKSPLSSNINVRLILKAFFEKLSDDYMTEKSTVKHIILNTSDVVILTEKLTVTEIFLNASDIVKLAAVVFGSIELSRFMLRHNCAVNYKISTTGHTALHCAIIFAKIDNAEMLIKHGAKINVKDCSGHAPLHYYIYNSQNEDENSRVLKLLLKYSNGLTEPGVNGISEVERLLLFGNKQTVKTVLQSGIDFDRMNFSGGRSLQHVLIKNENADVCELLDEFVTDFDVNARLSSGSTALIKAAQIGSVREVEMLLKLGADANFTTYDDESIFDCIFNSQICENDIAKITGILLQYGADPQRKFFMNNSFVFWKQELSIKVIIAHLALINTIDKSALNYIIRFKIKSELLLQIHFDLCMKKLEELKNVYVFKNITLFKLLSEKEGKIVAYFRNPELVLAFKSIMDKLSDLEPYYYNILQRRLQQAMNIKKLQEKIAISFELLTGLCGDTYHTIMYEIISYLDLKDLNNLSRIESIVSRLSKYKNICNVTNVQISKNVTKVSYLRCSNVLATFSVVRDMSNMRL